MTAGAFSLVFVVALAATLAARLWLVAAADRARRGHRDAVPAAFAARIGIAAHRKAADYTIAKQRLGELETVVDAIVLLALTLGGGLAALFAWTEALGGRPLWRDVLLLFAVAAVIGLVEPAVRVVADVRDRGALRLQPDDAEAVAEPISPRASRSASSSGCRSPSSCCG